ncbi:hypothetical protein BN131_3712 [Cronobacter malonaticus 681]|nr:hypothetical protein BN131_3712 [Cronobacter malonaticus 681]
MKQILILMILTITAAQALADDIHLQINGAIMAASCEVEGGSKNKTVEMGEALFPNPTTGGRECLLN